MPLGGQGSSCVNTYDCASGLFCWYSSPQAAQVNVTTCLPLYSQPVGTVFGWVYVDTADGMTNALTNGQYCSSGFAVYSGNYQAVCSTIKQVTSDFGPVPAPYKCTVGNPMNTCRYYYDSQSYITQECQCGFDPTIGYCQYPGQQELTNYIQSLYPVYNASKCHTLDRFNLRA